MPFRGYQRIIWEDLAQSVADLIYDLRVQRNVFARSILNGIIDLEQCATISKGRFKSFKQTLQKRSRVFLALSLI